MSYTTPLQAYLEQRTSNQQASLGNIQQAGALQTLMSNVAASQRAASMRDALANSGGDLEKALAVAIQSGDLKAAHELAPLLESQRKAKAQAVLTTLTPDQLKDPDYLDKLGASGVPGTAHFTAAAARIRQQRENTAALDALRGPQVEGQPRMNEQLAALMKSDVPLVPERAKALNAGLQGNSALPASYWQTHIENLSREHTGALERRNAVELARQDKKDTASSGLLNDEDASFMAGQYLAGDRTVLQNLGRGNQGAENIVKLRRAIAQQAREQGATPRDVAAAIGEFEGFKSGQRALGTRQAQIEMAGNVTKQFSPLAIEASANFDRTEFKTLNDVEKAALSRTSSPELRRFNFANTSLINAYARAINPTGVATVNDKEHAREILDTGFSKGDYAAAVDQLNKEIDAELKAPGAVKREMRDRLITPPGAQAAPPVAAPTSAAPTPSVSGWSIKPRMSPGG